MTFDISTKASGHFDIFRLNFDGTESLICSTPNLITNAGLDMVAVRPWNENFVQAVLGSGTTAAQNTDTTLATIFPTVPSTTTLSPNAGDHLTTGSYNNTTGVTTYTFRRTLVYNNTSGSTRNLTEVGMTSGGTFNASNYTLFNRAVLPSTITIPNGENILIRYTLTLSTDGTKAWTNNVFKDGTAIENTSGAVITTVPFKYINEAGNSTTGAVGNYGNTIFEPSLPIYLTYLAASTVQNANHSARRTAFINSPVIAAASPRYGAESVNGNQCSISSPRDGGAFSAVEAYTPGSKTVHKQVVKTFGENISDIDIFAIVGINPADAISASTTWIDVTPNIGEEAPQSVMISYLAGGLQWRVGTGAVALSALSTDRFRVVLRQTWDRA
jgi:hypothetical protein